MVKLNPLETVVLLKMGESNDGNGGDFGMIEDIVLPGMNQMMIGGYVSALQAKGLIKVYPPTSVNDYYVTQFTFTPKGLKVLAKSKGEAT